MQLLRLITSAMARESTLSETQPSAALVELRRVDYASSVTLDRKKIACLAVALIPPAGATWRDVISGAGAAVGDRNMADKARDNTASCRTTVRLATCDRVT